MDYALIPQENTIFGMVVESYDSFRLPELGQDKFIRGEKSIGIQHSLVIRKGVELANVKKIISHEQVNLCPIISVCDFLTASQALGQCSQYLSEHFPDAILEKRPSTADAAMSLLDPDEGFEGDRAAICSSVCATMFENLEVVATGIQNEKRE